MMKKMNAVFLITALISSAASADLAARAKTAEKCIQAQEEYFRNWNDTDQFKDVKNLFREHGYEIPFVTTDSTPRNSDRPETNPNPRRPGNFTGDEKIKLIKKGDVFTPPIASVQAAKYDFVMIRPDFGSDKKCVLVSREDIARFARSMPAVNGGQDNSSK